MVVQCVTNPLINMGTVLLIIYLITILTYVISLTVLTVTKDETWGLQEEDHFLVAFIMALIPLVNISFAVVFIGQICVNRNNRRLEE